MVLPDQLISFQANKLLCIVGPTATGKTALAVHLSELFPSALVSADSRQVYRNMDIVTGKDHPLDVRIHGIDLCNPDEPFSVSNWYDAVLPTIRESPLSIIVGGTGLYVKTILTPPETLHVPINQPLRDNLTALSTNELIDRLHNLDSARLTSMNNSDLHNPRRLIRAIEVAAYQKSNKSKLTSLKADQLISNIIGLLPPSDPPVYQDLIRKRVIARLEAGAVQETQKLLTRYPSSTPSLTAIGYRSIIRYLSKEFDEQVMIDTWVLDEYRYAKRQLLYMRKMLACTWFAPSDYSQVEKHIKNWYDNSI